MKIFSTTAAPSDRAWKALQPRTSDKSGAPNRATRLHRNRYIPCHSRFRERACAECSTRLSDDDLSVVRPYRVVHLTLAPNARHKRLAFEACESLRTG